MSTLYIPAGIHLTASSELHFTYLLGCLLRTDASGLTLRRTVQLAAAEEILDTILLDRGAAVRDGEQL